MDMEKSVRHIIMFVAEMPCFVILFYHMAYTQFEILWPPQCKIDLAFTIFTMLQFVFQIDTLNSSGIAEILVGHRKRCSATLQDENIQPDNAEFQKPQRPEREEICDDHGGSCTGITRIWYHRQKASLLCLNPTSDLIFRQWLFLHKNLLLLW